MRPIGRSLLLLVVCGCNAENTSTPRPVDPSLNRRPATIRYRITPLPPNGPGLSQGAGINDDAWVSGYTGMPDGTRQAALWRGTAITVLGTLPGGAHSMVQWPGINDRGTIVGISRTGVTDSLGESWSCSAFLPGAGKVCLGFVWKNGTMRPLPTLGGTNGFAAGVNARGQVVGWAETKVHDPTCVAPQVLQFRALVWEPWGARRTLRPIHGDSTSAATAINGRGQVVGISGACDVAVGRRSAAHAVLWDHGKPHDIGNIGGQYWHTPMAINERGDVVGFGNPPDGDIDGDSLRAFAWTRAHGIRDLGKLPGDAFSQALGINERGQIVGVSCLVACQAILWQDGVMHKLQDLVEAGFTGQLWSARGINERGQITGRMLDAAGVRMPYIATPITVP
jgi:uncharacterized membrane protein